MTEIQNSNNPVLVIEYWSLRFICNLVLGIWNFVIVLLQYNKISRTYSPIFSPR